MEPKRSRPIVPILLALVGVWFWVMSHSSSHSSVKSEPHSRAHGGYALDASKDNWPPLTDSASAPATAQATATTNYYLVLDGSGSMTDSDCSGQLSKISAAILALGTFIDAVPAQANIGLAVFDEAGMSERVPLAVDNRAALHEQLEQVSAKGQTPLRSAITLAYEKLTDRARSQLGYGEYHLVVVTDGAPQPDSEDPKPIVDQILAESPVLLHTIGFCIGTDHVLNQAGRTLYTAADSPDDLKRGLDDVLAEAPVFDVTKFGN